MTEPDNDLDLTDYTVEVEPDNPLIEGDSKYSVRLVVRVGANNPLHARDRFIQMLAEYGLTTWAFRVIDEDTDVEYLVQEDAVMMPEEFAALMEQQRQENADDDDDDDDDEIVDTNGRT